MYEFGQVQRRGMGQRAGKQKREVLQCVWTHPSPVFALRCIFHSKTVHQSRRGGICCAKQGEKGATGSVNR